MSGIFVSYRRGGGVRTHTYRLVDELRRQFGDDQVFLDVKSIDPGVRYADAIRDAITNCSVVLVIIGPRWLELEDEQGRRRLENPDDVLRIEVESALGAAARVIPVLLDGATMPPAERLPEGLRELAELQAFELTESHWDYDTGKLVERLRGIMGGKVAARSATTKPPFSGKVIAAAILVAMVVMAWASDEVTDRDTALGGLALSLGGLVLAAWGMRDIRAALAGGRITAVLSLLFGVLITLVLLGEWEDLPASSGSAMQPSDEVALLSEEHRLEQIEAGFAAEERERRAAQPGLLFREPGETFRDCGQCPKMVVVPRGHFRMGSGDGEAVEQPVHVVAIHHRLAVGVYEITRAEFAAFIAANPDYAIEDGCLMEADGELMTRPDRNWRAPGFAQDDSHPVVCVSMKDMQAYIDWLNTLVDGAPYRLPSEAEWEYAARSGKQTRYWWGDDMEPDRANCDRCGSRWDNAGTAPVGTFASNLFSIADSSGNVGERVEDCKNTDYRGAPVRGEPWLNGDCTYRGVRGGRFSTNPKNIRPASRNWFLKGKRVNSIGFRVVRDLP